MFLLRSLCFLGALSASAAISLSFLCTAQCLISTVEKNPPTTAQRIAMATTPIDAYTRVACQLVANASADCLQRCAAQDANTASFLNALTAAARMVCDGELVQNCYTKLQPHGVCGDQLGEFIQHSQCYAKWFSVGMMSFVPLPASQRDQEAPTQPAIHAIMSSMGCGSSRRETLGAVCTSIRSLLPCFSAELIRPQCGAAAANQTELVLAEVKKPFRAILTNEANTALFPSACADLMA